MIDDSQQQLAKRLLGEIKSFPEEKMRRSVIEDKLSDLSPELFAKTLTAIVESFNAEPTRFAAFAPFLQSLEKFLAALPYDFKQDLYQFAEEQDYRQISKCLIGFKKQQEERQVPPNQPADPLLEQLTLGEKRSLARTNNRDLIRRLINDDSKMVALALLQNPHLTVNDVLKMAAKRPASAEVLAAIASSKRFVKQLEIRRALLLNPSSLKKTKNKVLLLMNAGELRTVLKLLASNPELAQEVEEVLQRRK